MVQHAFMAQGAAVRAARRRWWQAALLVSALMLLLPVSAAFAGPVAPIEVSLTQPNGTAIVVTPFGDEWYSGYEYQGYTILLEPVSGYWVYAQSGVGGALIPSSWRAGLDKPAADLPLHLRDRQVMQSAVSAGSRISPNKWAGASGTQRVLVILTDFNPSTSRGTTAAQWNQLFFDTTPGAKSVRNYYSQASFSQFDLAPAAESYGTVNDGVIAVTLNYAHPYPLTAQANREISYNALVAANPYIDYSSLDTNGNGALDTGEVHLMIIVRGYEESYGGTGGACTPNVWGHRGSLSSTPNPPQLDGVWVAAYAYGGGYTQEGEWHEMEDPGTPQTCGSEPDGHMATMGIMVHELGHDIDWPDLYDTNSADGSDSAGVGNWSIMAGGSWGWASGDTHSGQTPVLPDAFLKWYQGWITPTPITVPTLNVAIPNSAQNAAAYLLGVNTNGLDWDFGTTSGAGEYFLVENRQQVGFDAGLRSISAGASGCLIYHIDETRTAANTANANPTRKLVDVEEADGSPQDLDLDPPANNNGDSGDSWPGNTVNTTFDDFSDPNSNWYDGSTSGIAVTNISTAGGGCTVDFSDVGPTWTGSVDSNWDDVDNWTTARVPNQNDNVVIPGVPNLPDVNGAASVGNLNILNGAQLNATADVTLNVYGNWAEVGTGNFSASAGTVIFRGTAAQSITAGNSLFNNVQIGDGATSQTVTANSDLDINGNVTIQSGAQLAAGPHALNVGGNWIDNPLGFDPGTGVVVFDGATQTIQRSASELTVYSNDLSSTTGWTTYDANGGGYWSYSTSAVPPNTVSGNLHARYFFDSSLPGDDWLFSPGFILQAGVQYTIRFNYGAASASYPEKLAAYIGNSQSVAAMTAPVFDNDNVTNTVWEQGSGTFTPSTTGTYYVGFYCYSDADMYYPAIDDLVVVAVEPDLTFYDLEIAGSDTTTLGDNAVIQSNLTVNSGVTLTLDTYDVSVEGTVTNDGRMAQTRLVNVGGATFLHIQDAAASTDKYWGAIVTPAGDMGATTVVIGGNQDCTTNTNDPLIRRCFNISPTTDQTATVRFYFTYDELNGRTFNTLRPWHWNPGWTQAGDTFIHSATCDAGQQDCWMEAQNISTYSPFGLGNVTAPTAINLQSLTANPIEAGGPIGLALPALLGLTGGVLIWKRRQTR